jgi:hypothetical protein
MPSLALWMLMSNGASLPLLRVTSLLPRGRQNSATSLLVVYWAAMLRNSLMMYLKMSLCLLWRESHVRRSGHALASPWWAYR